ncbi:uncharacterized protein J8A68_002044 [[Candida] subhashii]|uniref:Transcription factor CBF/NF-Y/archaeal histone domain-containing protein n=1 Tax=[Candida] subhashii TaxID=561895 RepID=A0A8J5UQ26_9ASCO|nr:uncharacterized protein J8A68_002044 [[Candida] subhashii]KAG7664441.1 hypothetical protein J8A68_002044 [[Candida] subhashii]
MSNLSQLINPDDDYSYSYTPPIEIAPKDSTISPTATTTNNNNDDEDESEEPTTNETTPAEPNTVTQEMIEESFEKIKTHFPAARIKKIMQSDEEIGKVAQATPIIVGRALEIFMANLVEVSILEAKKQGVKRISASHVRAAIENTEQFDFLVEAVEKYPPLKN